MKKRIKITIKISGAVFAALFFLAFIQNLPGADQSTSSEIEIEPNKNIWVTAYLASWQHNAGTAYSNWGQVRTQDIDWDAITHLIYFALNIGPDGRPSQSLNPEERGNFNEDRLRAIVPAAHRNNTRILFSVGGSGNYDSFSSAIKKENRTEFINTIINMIQTYGFDGVDLDMEPIRKKDFSNFYQFVLSLEAHFASIQTWQGDEPMITIAALKGREVMELYSRLQYHVEQINIMTYDMAQAWEGWQAWHNSALHSDGVTFDGIDKEFSSIHQKVELALDAGIKRHKLGIGLDFYGYIWHGVHFKGKWENWPNQNLGIMERSGGVPYYELSNRFNLDDYSWDEKAQSPYLNVENPKAFVTFDNEQSMQAKVQYAMEQGLGGVMLWELGGGFIKDNPPGMRDPLLKAVKSTRQQYTLQQ